MKKKLKKNLNLSNYYRKYKSEVWGDFLKRKKFDNKSWKAILDKFEFLMNREFTKTTKKLNFRSLPLLSSNKRFKHNLYKRIKSLRPLTFKKTNNYLFKNSFNFTSPGRPAWLEAYLIYRRFYIFKKRFGKKIFFLNKKLYKFKKRKKQLFKPESTSTVLKSFTYGIMFFCGFRNKDNLAKFYKSLFLQKKSLGFESLLNVFFFRLNFVATTRLVHLLLKAGVVNVNGVCVKNPHFKLKLLDKVSITQNYRKLMFKLFLKRLKKEKKFLINVPEFICYNYRIMLFCIWRIPKENESIFPHDFPFIDKSRFITL
jgi:ribosomal protein S4